MRRVCLITTGQPSTNPRLVKEADALAEARYDVTAIGAFWAEWAALRDPALMAGRPWSFQMIDWRRERGAARFQAMRLRHAAARRLAESPAGRYVPPVAVFCRVGPELARAAAAHPADLYIAHNLGALPAALHAARVHRAGVGFDAEDFHSGQLPATSAMARFTAAVERDLLPRCDYVTAAAPGIAEAYRDRCGIALPACVLNVFPLADRPEVFRAPAVNEPVRLYWFSQTIGPDRGLEMAVQALARLRRYPAELHLRGTPQHGFDTDLLELARREGVKDGAVHILGPDASDQMVRCAARFDIGLALEPVVSENNDILWSNKIFTYLLAGCAVAVTRTRGQSLLLPDLHAAGVGCQPQDAASLADALEPWLANPARLLEARRCAWTLAERTYNWDMHKSVFLATVERALAH